MAEEANTDLLKPFLGSLVRHGLTTAAGSLAAHGALSGSDKEQFVGAGMFLAGLAWSWWKQRGHALVAEEFNRLLRRTGAAVAFAAVLLAGVSAFAADVPPPVVKAVPRAAFVPTPCTVQFCSGFYVGGNIVGVGSNLDILGGGINGSIFAGGGMVGLDGGYQLWNGVWFAALEGGVEYDATNTLNQAGTPFARRWSSYQVVKLGRGLNDLFSFQSAGTTPSQGPAPISIPATIAQALASPYLQFGAFERFGVGTGWVSGAGADFIIANGWNLDLNYKRVQYQGLVVNGVAVKDENLVQLSLNRKF